MAISKKKSRLINIEGQKYRWLVSGNNGYNVFVAEKENVKGRKIEVYFDTDINNLWSEFPNIDNFNLKVIKPKDSESIIRQALNLGWNPDEKGKPLVFDMIDDKIIGRFNKRCSSKKNKKQKH